MVAEVGIRLREAPAPRLLRWGLCPGSQEAGAFEDTRPHDVVS